MQKKKFRVLLYLKKSCLDKQGQAPIMGRMTYERTQAQFSRKMSCAASLSVIMSRAYAVAETCSS